MFSWQVSLDDSACHCSNFQTFLVYIDLTVLRNTTQAFYGMSSMDLPDVFLRVELGFGALERTSEMKGHSHHITSRVHADNMIYN